MSLLVEAITEIAKESGKSLWGGEGPWYQGKHDFVVLSYRDEFEGLWGLNSGEEGIRGIARRLASQPQKGNNGLTILIVWDGTPPGEHSNVLGYVTPYHWAMALSLELYGKANNKQDEQPKLRFLIVDVCPNYGGNDHPRRWLAAFRQLFPWIQDFRPTPISEERREKLLVFLPAVSNGDANSMEDYAFLRSVVPPGHFHFEDLVKDIRDPQRIQSTFGIAGPETSNDLAIALAAWKDQLCGAAARHSVANIVAPLVLANALPESWKKDVLIKIASTPPRRALYSLLQTLEIAAMNPAKSPANSIPIVKSSAPGFFGRKVGVRFLLVDDLFNLGYQHVVQRVIFGNENGTDTIHGDGTQEFDYQRLGSLVCRNNVDDLLRRLPFIPIATDKEWSMPRRLDVGGDILILDLRLWSDTQNPGPRNDFLTLVLAAAEKVTANGTSFGSKECRRAYQAVSSVLEKGLGLNEARESELEAIALLPLLINDIDPSLPIVLFSSTHQRTVEHMMSGRPCLITEFAKPLLTDHAEAQNSDRIGLLRQALSKAVDLHEARLVWEKIVKLQIAAPPSVSVVLTKNSTDYFLDEYGNDHALGAGGPIAFKPHAYSVSNIEIKDALANLYRGHVLNEAWHDFLDAPQQLLEGALAPTNVLGNRNVTRCKIGVQPALNTRVALYRAISSIRHRKAHGFSWRAEVKGHVWDPDRRVCALLIFLVFIDFLADNDKMANGCIRLWSEMSDALRRRRGRRISHRGPIDPEKFVPSERINTGEFVSLALAAAAARAGQFLSVETEQALTKVVHSL